MKLEGYTITIIVGILTSAGFGMIITVLFSRKKINAETVLAKAQTQFNNVEAYSIMLNDLRTQINMQGDQIKNQAAQILNLQEKENQYIKIIKANAAREREYVKRIKDLEKSLKASDDLLREYQLKLPITDAL